MVLKKIVVALDGSENAERALPWVRQYARRETALVVLFRAVPTEGLEPEWVPVELGEARDYVGRIEKEIRYAGIPCRAVALQGRAAESIVKEAREEQADLIIMTTRGGSPVKRWLIGGVTEQVLRLSPVPVLVVRSGMPLPKQGRIRRLIVPVDGSKRAETPVPWTEKLARMLKARIVFLHVYPTGAAGLKTGRGPAYEALHQRMARICLKLRRAGVKASFKVRRGDAADRILAYADREDLIVTTTHGFGGFKRWVFGSVAEKLIHASGIPVVVYKTSAQAEAVGVA